MQTGGSSHRKGGRPAHISERTQHIVMTWRHHNPDAPMKQLAEVTAKHCLPEPLAKIKRWLRNRVYRQSACHRKTQPDFIAKASERVHANGWDREAHETVPPPPPAPVSSFLQTQALEYAEIDWAKMDLDAYMVFDDLGLIKCLKDCV